MPQCSNSADVVLTWPNFDGLFSPDFLNSTLLADEDVEAGKNLQNVGQRTELTSGRAVNYEDAPVLVDRFLAFVHTKNPILNVPEVRIYARRLAEEGPLWDAPSCLVVSVDLSRRPIMPGDLTYWFILLYHFKLTLISCWRAL